MSDVTESTNVDNGKSNKDLMSGKKFNVCCIGFQKGPQMEIFPAEQTEIDYVFQSMIDELRQKFPNEDEVQIQAVVPKLREEYEAVKAKLKKKQAEQEKALFGNKENEDKLLNSDVEK